MDDGLGLGLACMDVVFSANFGASKVAVESVLDTASCVFSGLMAFKAVTHGADGDAESIASI